MARKGRPKTAPIVKCPVHPGTSVISKGTRTVNGGGVRRRYLCSPENGGQHSFTVAEIVPGERVVPITDVPPQCLTHPDSHVIRYGPYASTRGLPRQRYRCTPKDPDQRPHVFTPTLPRKHVHPGGDTCESCQEVRGVHHGEAAFARHNSWPLLLVAQGLARLASGESYASVGQWAVRRSVEDAKKREADEKKAAAKGPKGNKHKVGKSQPDTAPPRKVDRSSKSAWHIGADWTEAAAPVLFDHIDRDLRENALNERARLDLLIDEDKPVDKPQVLIVDDDPVSGTRPGHTGRRRQQDGFYILVLAELSWEGPKPRTRLRLARAMPIGSAAAWALVFDELGYIPDILISDGASAIAKAAGIVFAGKPTHIPSLYHIATAVQASLLKEATARSTTAESIALKRPLDQHLRRIRAGSGTVSEAAEWSQWWDELEDIARQLQVPVRRISNLRKFHEPRLADSHQVFKQYPRIPASTGAVETLIRRTIHPLLAMRRSAFGNIERTNRLLDLVVCKEHGLFDDIRETARILRKDVESSQWGGHTTSLRAVTDTRPPNGHYSSLMDAFSIEQLARERGLIK